MKSKRAKAARATGRPDDENPEITGREAAQMRPFAEVFPDMVERQKRGRPKLERPKRLVSLRLSDEVLEHFRAGGPGWQTRIDETLVRQVQRDSRAGQLVEYKTASRRPVPTVRERVPATSKHHRSAPPSTAKKRA
jgi:uncharacterized protein (DUF4415 family)